MRVKRKTMWVLLDFDGSPIRYFDYQATGTVKIRVEIPQFNLDLCEECLF